MMVQRLVVVLLVLMVVFVGCGGEEEEEEDSGGVATVVNTIPAIRTLSKIGSDGVLVINFDDGRNIKDGVIAVLVKIRAFDPSILVPIPAESISLVNNQAKVVFSGLPVSKFWQSIGFEVSWVNTDGTLTVKNLVFEYEPEVKQPLTEMVLIPAGSFEMGDHFDEGRQAPDNFPVELIMNVERPVHRVELDAFYMDVHEVTVGQFKQFVEETGYDYAVRDTQFLANLLNVSFNEAIKLLPSYDYDDYPRFDVSWHDAKAYASWVGKRLPTEAEWEYAARGGLAGKRYPWGDNWRVAGAYVNLKGTDGGMDKWRHAAPVKSFEPNGVLIGMIDITIANHLCVILKVPAQVSGVFCGAALVGIYPTQNPTSAVRAIGTAVACVLLPASTNLLGARPPDFAVCQDQNNNHFPCIA